MNIEEIVGFAEPRNHTSKKLPLARFGLIEELQRVRQAEIARITGIADQLSRQFGLVIATGFLYAEILGQPARGADWNRYIEKHERALLDVPAIVEELQAMAHSKSACLPAAVCEADPDRPAG